MPLEPLPLSLNRADAVQQVQNLFVAAERAGKASAARETLETGRQQPATVPGPEAAAGSRIREEETAGSGGYEGPERQPAEESGGEETEAGSKTADPEGRGRRLDITA